MHLSLSLLLRYNNSNEGLTDSDDDAGIAQARRKGNDSASSVTYKMVTEIDSIKVAN